MGERICLASGEEIDLCNSQYGGCWGAWNDKVRSIQGISSSSSVLLYLHSGFDHYLTEFTAGQPVLSQNYFEMTSLRVQKPKNVCLYQRDNFQGPQKCFGVEESVDLCDASHGGCWGPWNDDVRSIFVGRGVEKVSLYEHA